MRFEKKYDGIFKYIYIMFKSVILILVKDNVVELCLIL